MSMDPDAGLMSKQVMISACSRAWQCGADRATPLVLGRQRVEQAAGRGHALPPGCRPPAAQACTWQPGAC